MEGAPGVRGGKVRQYGGQASYQICIYRSCNRLAGARPENVLNVGREVYDGQIIHKPGLRAVEPFTPEFCHRSAYAALLAFGTVPLPASAASLSGLQHGLPAVHATLPASCLQWLLAVPRI